MRSRSVRSAVCDAASRAVKCGGLAVRPAVRAAVLPFAVRLAVLLTVRIAIRFSVRIAMRGLRCGCG